MKPSVAPESLLKREMTSTQKHKGSGHRSRLREKFLRAGLAGFLDYEIVELLLTLGEPRKDRKAQAKAVMRKFKSLKGALEASDEELLEIKGLGPNNIFGLKLIKEMAGLYLKEKAKEKPLAPSPRAVYDYLRQSMGGLKKEVFKIVFLNNANRIIEVEELFRGTVDQAAVHPREVIKAALKHNATRLILAHNHPAGSLRPSPEDIEITTKLKVASSAVGIEVLDHIVIGGGDYFSLKEHNLF
jgi:DNA repair protein RadC